MPYVQKYENNYQAFSKFEENCLLNDQSLIWPDKKLWTIENLAKLESMYGDENIDSSVTSFEGKLELQLKSAGPEIWGIIADLLYVYTLPSSYIKFDKKLEYIGWAASKAGFQIPPKDDELWEPLKIGYVHTGIQYHTKFWQLLLLINFAKKIKESEVANEILNDSTKTKDVLDVLVNKIEELYGRAPRDMRQIILYFKFPNEFESIISTTGKENIIKFYSKKFSLDIPDDYDEALLQIRNYIQKDLPEAEKPIHFYDKKYKIEWDPDFQTVKPGSGGETDQDLDPQLITILHALVYSKNLILSGPPGTGKTYLANKAADLLIESQLDKEISTEAKNFRIVEGLTFYDILGLDFYMNDGESYSVPEIEGHDLIAARFAIRPVENPRQIIWNYLQTHTAPDSETVKVARRVEPYLFDKDENSKWTLTSEGRKYVEQNLSDFLEETKKDDMSEHKPEDFIKKVTFHQSFAYEDFIEGIRPRIGEEESGDITYEIFPGVFSEICRLALNDPENKYVLIIDEINRGNISKIFGELITLIEDDKRNILSVKLPYSKRDFVVPKNLYIIGTMNTADRSIALMDVALRRRFTFIEMMPRSDLLQNKFVSTSEIDLSLEKLMDKLNEFVEKEIDRNHQIGHSYFLKVANADQENKLPVLSFVWNHQIFPLLKEYFYSQHDKLIDFLSPFTDDGNEADFEEMLKEGDDLLYALSKIYAPE